MNGEEEQLAARARSSLFRVLPDEPGRSRRIDDLYIPIYLWLSRALEEHRAAHIASVSTASAPSSNSGSPGAKASPLVVGISAPQGSGKSTLALHLVALFAERGLHAASVSIDDFYLRNHQQRALAEAHPDHPYLKYRGYPGTHDVELGANTIDAMRALDTDRPLRIPTYDKSAFAGRGDRKPESEWREIRGPLDLILVEGWILGFQPFDAEGEARIDDAHLRDINQRLRAYEAWSSRLSRMVIWSADELEHIVNWRVDAEARSARAGRPALDPAAIEDYIRRCIPAYWLYADTVAQGRWSPNLQLQFRLDADRLPLK